jgi:hypothetical protein
MKKFVLKILLFLFPLIILPVFFSIIDVFKFFGEYDNYYKDSYVSINREHVCLKTLSKNREHQNYNSFIFGSSRSQAFKTSDWVEYLDSSASPFHFDASGEGIFGISNKVKYLDKLGDSINNALVILDRTVLSLTQSRNGHLFIPNPDISEESWMDYYITIFKAKMNPKFALAYLDYSMFKEYRTYMGKFIIKEKYPNSYDSITCDLWYGKDQQIKNDSINYYNNLIKRKIFYNRPTVDRLKLKLTDLEKEQLQSIKQIFDKHETNYKIIISPVYNQIEMEKDQCKLLDEIFQPQNVFNYSGINRYTEPVGNYYESSHFRPSVSKSILEEIYSNQ